MSIPDLNTIRTRLGTVRGKAEAEYDLHKPTDKIIKDKHEAVEVHDELLDARVLSIPAMAVTACTGSYFCSN